MWSIEISRGTRPPEATFPVSDDLGTARQLWLDLQPCLRDGLVIRLKAPNGWVMMTRTITPQGDRTSLADQVYDELVLRNVRFTHEDVDRWLAGYDPEIFDTIGSLAVGFEKDNPNAVSPGELTPNQIAHREARGGYYGPG